MGRKPEMGTEPSIDYAVRSMPLKCLISAGIWARLGSRLLPVRISPILYVIVRVSGQPGILAGIF